MHGARKTCHSSGVQTVTAACTCVKMHACAQSERWGRGGYRECANESDDLLVIAIGVVIVQSTMVSTATDNGDRAEHSL